MNKNLLIAVILVFLAAGSVWYISDFKNESKSQEEQIAEKPDLIRVFIPKPNDAVKSPVIIKGEARGFWFFEASFPIRIFDDTGRELGLVVAQAQGEWMTKDFVPFEAQLEFKNPAAKSGTLVLEKDNPSGLPEHADELRIPVVFEE